MPHRSSLLLCLIIAAPFQSMAQQATELNQRVEAMQRHIEEQDHRIDVLSQALESSKDEPVSSAPDSRLKSPPESIGLSPAAGKVYGVQGGLSVGGYGETVFSAFSHHLQNGSYSPQDSITDLLRGVLYVGYKFTPWLIFNSEYEWEHGGFSDLHAQGESIVEFAYLDFLITPAINIRAGQILIPAGFINELHEPPVFLGALRPSLEQEDGIIPTTWHENGLGIHGTLPHNLSYRVYLVNGLDSAHFNTDGTGSIGGGRQSGHQAIANRPAYTGRLDWHLLPGALVGGSFYTGDSAQQTGATSLWTTLFELHAEYRARGFQARGLYAHLSNGREGVAALAADAPARGVGTEQSGGYLEAAYDLMALVPSSRQSVLPFFRVERFNTQQSTTAGQVSDRSNDRTVIALGANYKPIPQVALKADYDLNLNRLTTGRNQFNLALGYLF